MKLLSTVSVLLLAATTTTTAFKLPALTPKTRLATTTTTTTSIIRGGSLWSKRQPNNKHIPTTTATTLQVSAAADDPTGSAEKKQVWIEPAFHNKLSVRLMMIVAGVALAAKGANFALPKNVATFFHLLFFGANLGSVLYTSFVLGIVMIKQLPRQIFGRLQSKLFPIYFAWSCFSLGVQLLTGNVMGLNKTAMQWLGVSLAAALANALYLEPASTRVMFARYALDKEGKTDSPEYKALAKKFGAFHGASSLINLIVVVGGFVHAYFLSLLLV